jgi:hypothetical protein
LDPIKDCLDVLEEEGARRLLRQQLSPWLEEIKPILLELHRSPDPRVKTTVGKLQLHIVQLVTGLTTQR